MVNIKTDTSKKISIYGKFKIKEVKNYKNIEITNKSVCNIIEDFYTFLEDNNIKIEKIEEFKVSKLIFDNKIIPCKEKRFFINGYAEIIDYLKKREMRSYFSIDEIQLSQILQEFKIFYEYHIKYFLEKTSKIRVIVEGFKIL